MQLTSNLKKKLFILNTDSFNYKKYNNILNICAPV